MSSFHCVSVRFRYNLQVCGFPYDSKDTMIHLDGVLSLTAMLENVGNGVGLDVLHDKPSVFCNEVPGISMASSIITILDPVSIHTDFLSLSRSLSLRSYISLNSLSKISGRFSVADLKILIPVPNV